MKLEAMTSIIQSLTVLQGAAIGVQTRLESDLRNDPSALPTDEELQELYTEAVGAATCLLNLGMAAAIVCQQRSEETQPQTEKPENDHHVSD